MKLKRTKKRKTTQPHTKVPNFGFDKLLTKIDETIKLVDKN